MTPKEKFYTGLSLMFGSAVTVFVPLLYLLLIVGVFVFLDFLSGIAASLKQKQSFSWVRVMETFPKVIIYGVVIVALYIVEYKWLPGTHTGQLACAALCLRELKSMNKHSKTVLGESVLTTAINLLKKK